MELEVNVRLDKNMSVEASVKCASTVDRGTGALHLGAKVGIKPEGHINKPVSYADVVRGDNPG